MSRSSEHDPAIARWLILCLIIVFAMAMFDSINRLTPSDASALNQESAHNFLAPLNAEQWNLEFDRFRQSSEYKKIKPGMELAEFKSIFWYYYTQRTLGRLIIPLFLLPFLYFWWRDQIKPGLTPKLISIFLLAGVQGLIGWYLAQDYLADNPRASVYLLTSHLFNTVLIYGYMLWVILGLRDLQPYMPMRYSELAWVAIRLAAADRTGADKYNFGRICRRAQGRFVIQHLPVDGRTSNTPRTRQDVALVSESVRKQADRAIRTSHTDHRYRTGVNRLVFRKTQNAARAGNQKKF